MLGCTVIATNVGGTPSLIKDSENGFLVPANDPYQLAFRILYLANEKEKNKQIGFAAKATARKRLSMTSYLLMKK